MLCGVGVGVYVGVVCGVVLCRCRCRCRLGQVGGVVWLWWLVGWLLYSYLSYPIGCIGCGLFLPILSYWLCP